MGITKVMHNALHIGTIKYVVVKYVLNYMVGNPIKRFINGRKLEKPSVKYCLFIFRNRLVSVVGIGILLVTFG